VIDEVHEEVSDFKKGDEVYSYVAHLASSGTYTEYICVPSFLVAKKPLSLSHEEAAATPVAGITAWLALTKTKAQIAKSVFLAGGAGGVGSFVILFAKKFGVNNIVTTAGSSKSFYYLVQRLGISESRVLNYRNNNFVENTVDKKGYFDIAIDLVGGKILSACCSLLAIDGDLASATEIPTTNDFEVLFSKNASFHSIGTNAYSLSQNQFHHARYQQILNRITDLFDSGSISKPPVSVVGSFGLQTVRQAHIMLENNLAQGKLVMNF
jgi:NADPH:quinone reductase-like Zn-dependent oxidoreductase